MTARFPSAALAARCTSISGLCRRKRIGSKVSRSTSRTSIWQSAFPFSGRCPNFSSSSYQNSAKPRSPGGRNVSTRILSPASYRYSPKTIGSRIYVDVPRSVISAKVKLALRWRSTLSENTKVLNARSGSPEKKSVSPRY